MLNDNKLSTKLNNKITNTTTIRPGYIPFYTELEVREGKDNIINELALEVVIDDMQIESDGVNEFEFEIELN